MRLFYSFLTAALLSCGGWLSAAAQVLDPGFAPSSLILGSLGGIQALLKQPDGKVIVSGNIQLINGLPAPRVSRLNADGSPDLAFRAQAGAGPNSSITALALQADGKILLGAEYGLTHYNGTAVQNLIRLNSDGSLDATFNSGGTGWLGEIRSIAVQADGRILVGGMLSSTFNGQPTNGLIRLLPTGQPDASFATGVGFVNPTNSNGEVRKIIVQPDGNIVATGNFNTVGGQPRPAIARLTPTGSLDATFTSPFATNSYGLEVVRQPDGKLVVGGAQLAVNGSTTNNLVRLLPNGSPDATFTATLNQGIVLGIELRSNGSMLIAGGFNSFGGFTRGNLVRLSSTGVVDATFATGAGAGATIMSVVELNNGQHLAGGYFNQFDGQVNEGLVRLQSNGQLDASYVAALGYVASFPLLPFANGRLVLTSNSGFIFNGQPVGSPPVNSYSPQLHLINADGTYNAPVALPPAPPSPAGGTYYLDVAPQPDGTTYTAYQNTDTTMLVRHVLANGTFDPAYAAAELQFGSRSQVIACCSGVSLTSVAGGQLLVRGAFSRVNGQPRKFLARLLVDGTLNTQFAPPTNAAWQLPPRFLYNEGLRNAVGLANGQTLVLWNDATRSYVARLNPDGNLDNTFSIGTGGGPNSVFIIQSLANGSILVNGDFTIFNGQAAPYGLLRLLPSGAPDSGFTAASAARNAVEQPDGKLVVVAPDTNPQVERLLRLTATGSLDAGFQPVVIGNESFTPAAAVVYLQPGTNALLLGGSFTSVAGQPRLGLARLINTVLAVRGSAAAPLAEVFPNPAHEQISVRLPAQPTGPAILTDLQGRAVRRYLLGRTTDRLPLANLAPGVYLLSVPTTVGPARQRFVVE